MDINELNSVFFSGNTTEENKNQLLCKLIDSLYVNVEKFPDESEMAAILETYGTLPLTTIINDLQDFTYTTTSNASNIFGRHRSLNSTLNIILNKLKTINNVRITRYV